MSFLSHNLRLSKIWRPLSILTDFAYGHLRHSLNFFKEVLKMEEERPPVKPPPLRVHKLIYLVVVLGKMTGSTVQENWKNLRARKCT